MADEAFKKKAERLSEEIATLRQQTGMILQQNMPTFDRGVAEATAERSERIWARLQNIFFEEGIEPVINRKMHTDMHRQSGRMFPMLMHGGELVTLQYRVMPVGKEGRDKLPPEVQERVMFLENEMNKRVAELDALLSKGA